MSFSTETWREKAAIQYQNFKQWLKKGDAPFIAYGTVAGLSLWPLVETAVTAPPGQPLPVSLYLALGSVAGGVGGNLIAEQLGRWRDAAEPPTAETVTQWVADNAPNPDLRAALDAVLEKLDAIPQAQAGLAEADKIQFANALRREMAELGNWSKFETMLTVGSGAVAQGDGATAVGERAVHAGNVGGDIVTGSKIEQHTHYDAPPFPDAANWRAVYLNRLFAAHSRLSLAGIDPKTASDAKESRLNLGAVYTALLTQSVAEAESGGMGREQRRLSALEQLDRHPHFVLLGDPGSGKSTFVNFVALCLAGAGLGHETVNLDLLTAPSPDEKGEDGAERQSWQHGALLPVVVVLRDFAARGLPAAGQTATANHLWQFIEQDLKDAACPNYGDYLRRELQESGGLLLLDGLDEVPQANERRTQIKGAIERFAAAFPRVRILVASRTYAYQRQAWRLPDFDAAVLAPFKPGQIRRFVDRWYAHIAPLRGLHPDDAQGRAEQLKNAIFASRRLGELAERPLLLTLMSSLHAWRGGSLPEKREELYADTVDLLLDWWEKPKTVRDAEGGVSVEQPSLAEWLKVDRDKVRGLLNRLAYDAHTSQPELVGTADIPEGNLVSGLMRLSKNPDVNPALLVAYLRDRAGLLLPRGVGVYAFPHRTFQEYLAACHLTDHEYPELAARLARQAPNRWREAALLAGAKGARGSASTIWSLVEALCYDEPGDSLESAWGAHLAGQALVETADLAEVSPRNQAKVARLQRWLVHIMRGGQLPAVERAGAAVHLARLGDPRAEAMAVDGMQFCLIPKGAFWMGDGERGSNKLHQVAIPYDYWLGRYPVTNAQFQAFVEDGGYAQERYWREAQRQGHWRDGQVDAYVWRAGKHERGRRDRPNDYGRPFNLPNHPVVGVTWYEGVAFTRWLTERWRKSGLLAPKMRLALPSEAEWEKAARGGLETVSEPAIVIPESDRWTQTAATIPNPSPQRRYPTGEEQITSEQANFDNAEIGATSGAGCFSSGKSAYGCEEMSGNVWEWTQSAHKSYPYQADDGREALAEYTTRVLRGGAYYSDFTALRCAYRDYYDPHAGHHLIGFRVVASPFIPPTADR